MANKLRLTEFQRRKQAYDRLVKIKEVTNEGTLEELEKTKSFIVNSAQDMPPLNDGEYEREIKYINTKQIPVSHGSYLTDYDGIQMTINRCSQNFVEVRGRLEWSGSIIRALEMELWKKECLVAKYENREPPKKLPEVPFFDIKYEDDETNPGVYVMTQKAAIENLHKKLIDRISMIIIGLAISVFFINKVLG